jgi:DNA-binding LacI/PurR family transcriptional regulator
MTHYGLKIDTVNEKTKFTVSKCLCTYYDCFMKVKISDVVREAGVSRATVSRVLNGSPAVNPRTVALVRETMDRLGYARFSVRPGPKPRVPQAARLRTKVIALVIIGQTRTLLEEPIMARVIEGIQSACRKLGLSLLLDQMNSPDKLPFCVQTRQVDGVLVMLAGRRPSHFRESVANLSAAIPAVQLFTPGHSVASVDHVTVNDVAVGALAFRSLQAAGCRSLAVVDASPVFHEALLDRGRAFKDRAALNALPAHYFSLSRSDCKIEECLPQPLTIFKDFAEVAKGIQRDLPLPAGVFLTLEMHAPQLHEALAAAGLFKKGDVKMIISGTTARYVGHLDPPPLLIDLSFEEIIDIAVERLIDRILQPSGRALSFLVAPRLVEA